MSEVKVDTISERTAANGIVVDGVTIKDSGLTIPSGGTLTVASGGTITNSGTASGFGGGKVLQVISASTHTQTSVTSGSWTDTSLSASITLASTSNKVHVYAQGPVLGKKNATMLYWPILRLKETVTADIFPDTTALSDDYGFGLSPSNFTAHSSNRTGGIASMVWLHSPSSTSALTYTVQMNSTNLTTSEWCEQVSDTGVMILMEIEG